MSVQKSIGEQHGRVRRIIHQVAVLILLNVPFGLQFRSGKTRIRAPRMKAPVPRAGFFEDPQRLGIEGTPPGHGAEAEHLGFLGPGGDRQRLPGLFPEGCREFPFCGTYAAPGVCLHLDALELERMCGHAKLDLKHAALREIERHARYALISEALHTDLIGSGLRRPELRPTVGPGKAGSPLLPLVVEQDDKGNVQGVGGLRIGHVHGDKLTRH